MFEPCPGVTSNQASDPKRIAGLCLSLCLGTRTRVSSQALAQAAGVRFIAYVLLRTIGLTAS